MPFIFFIIPTIFLYGWFVIQSLHEHWQLSQYLGEIDAINDELEAMGIDPVEVPTRSNWLLTWVLFQVRMFFTLQVPRFITGVFLLLMQTPIVILLPLIATWCAEFNADQFVIAEQGTDQHLLKGFQIIAPTVSWWTWLTSRLSHPPTRMRQWIIDQGLISKTLLILMLLFPMMYVLRLSLMNLKAIATMMFLRSLGEMLNTLLGANAIGLRAMAPIMIVSGIILLVYPKLAYVWEGLFVKESHTVNPPLYKEYWVAAAVVGGLGIVSYSVASNL